MSPFRSTVIYIGELDMQRQSLLLEFLEFLKVRKRFWLQPIIIVLLIFSAMILFTESSAVAPFRYTLF